MSIHVYAYKLFDLMQLEKTNIKVYSFTYFEYSKGRYVENQTP